MELFGDASEIALYGTVLAFFIGLMQPGRTAWLASPHRWWLFAMYAGTPRGRSLHALPLQPC